MPRGGVCSVCNHPKILQIDAWIVQGVSSPEIVRRVGGLSKSSVHRHRVNGMHLASPSVRLAAEEEAGRFRKANRAVTIGLRAQQRALEAQQAVPAYEPPYEPPVPLPPQPQPINPPGKVLTEEEMRAVLARVRKNKQRKLKVPTYSYEEPRRVTYPM
jgi:hypothetical protein